MRLLSSLVVLGVVLCLGGNARAAEPDARTLFQEATAHFAVGEFIQAGEKYQAAYKLKPDPALLYNAAQSFRQGADLDKALLLYRNYLMFYPKARNAGEVEQVIGKLKEQIATRDAQKQVPPKLAEPAPAPTVEPTPAPAPVVADAPRRPTPIYKKWWLWTIVGVVVVGGVVTGAVLATRPSGTWETGDPIGPGAAQALVSF